MPWSVSPRSIETVSNSIGTVKVGYPTGAGTTAYIPLRELATISLDTGASYIYHEATKRFLPIKFGVRDRDLGSIVAEAQERIARNVITPLWIASPRFCARKARIVASSCAGRWTSIPGQVSAPPTVRPTCWPPSCSDSLRTWRRSPHGAVISTSAMSVCWHLCLRQGGSALTACPPYCASNHHMFYLLTANLQERTALIREAGILAVFHYVPLVLVPASKSLYRQPGPPLRTRWAVPRYWWWQRLRGAGPGRCRDRLRAAGARYRRRPGSACPGVDPAT